MAQHVLICCGHFVVESLGVILPFAILGVSQQKERIKRQLTQENLAQEFFVTRQLISKWENEKSYPDLDQVVKLSDYFQLPLDYLLKEDQAMVEELNFDSRSKKWLKTTVVSLALVIVGILVTVGLMIWNDLLILRPADFVVTQVAKHELPATIMIHPTTGQAIQLPADVEYVVSIESKRPFIDLDRVAGYAENVDQAGIQVVINGRRKLLAGNGKVSVKFFQTAWSSLGKPLVVTFFPLAVGLSP